MTKEKTLFQTRKETTGYASQWRQLAQLICKTIAQLGRAISTTVRCRIRLDALSESAGAPEPQNVVPSRSGTRCLEHSSLLGVFEMVSRAYSAPVVIDCTESHKNMHATIHVVLLPCTRSESWD